MKYFDDYTDDVDRLESEFDCATRASMYDLAAKLAKEAISLCRENRDLHRTGRCRAYLGKILHLRGDSDSAQGQLKKALTLLDESKHRFEYAQALEWLGYTYLRDDPGTAKNLILKAAEIFDKDMYYIRYGECMWITDQL